MGKAPDWLVEGAGSKARMAARRLAQVTWQPLSRAQGFCTRVFCSGSQVCVWYVICSCVLSICGLFAKDSPGRSSGITAQHAAHEKLQESPFAGPEGSRSWKQGHPADP